ncbi:hypothetical protein, partial [Pseudomonas coronafaciens]|uniref:hypothetical protein n=1 Tax=Pseudomonas coronafaciens TaxID=53409 RepID=UPI001C7EAED3
YARTLTNFLSVEVLVLWPKKGGGLAAEGRSPLAPQRRQHRVGREAEHHKINITNEARASKAEAKPVAACTTAMSGLPVLFYCSQI